jgi:hypothetical protein
MHENSPHRAIETMLLRIGFRIVMAFVALEILQLAVIALSLIVNVACPLIIVLSISANLAA